MADSETVIGRLDDGRLMVKFSSAAPSSYSQTDEVQITITKLGRVEEVVSLDASQGYDARKANVAITGNKIVFPLYYQYYACPVVCATGWEVTTGRDVSDVTVYGVVIGR
ncbi:MAG: hypothetical protein PHI12_11205 [Dehalococcoidales bacterium]|nr:hypothetical protein [Dehalococcoidales bacterium]